MGEPRVPFAASLWRAGYVCGIVGQHMDGAACHVEQSGYERAWRIASAVELPFPHGLFHDGCPFADDHQRILSEIGACADRYGVAFERFVGEVGARMGECKYHQPDWHLATRAAVEIVESGRGDEQHAGFLASELARERWGG